MDGRSASNVGVRGAQAAPLARRRGADRRPEGRVARVALRRLRQIGLALICLQFLAFCIWSAILVHRVALTHDFITYEQAFFLISHGHLDPFSSSLGYPFWQDHGSFLLWPLAFLNWLWPHPVTLLWLQDAAAVGCRSRRVRSGSVSSPRARPGAEPKPDGCRLGVRIGVAIVLFVVQPVDRLDDLLRLPCRAPRHALARCGRP